MNTFAAIDLNARPARSHRAARRGGVGGVFEFHSCGVAEVAGSIFGAASGPNRLDHPSGVSAGYRVKIAPGRKAVRNRLRAPGGVLAPQIGPNRLGHSIGVRAGHLAREGHPLKVSFLESGSPGSAIAPGEIRILGGGQAGQKMDSLRGVFAWRHATAARVQSQSMDSRTVDLRSGAVAVDAERTTGTAKPSGEMFAW